MSKDAKIDAIKPHLSALMDKIIIANDAQYGGEQHKQASPLAAFLMVGAAKARGSGSANMVKQDWLRIGEDLYNKRLTAKKDSLNVVCDTLCGVVLWVIDHVIHFEGRFELFSNPAPTHHHFVVVDRLDGSDEDDRSTWGAACFVVDLWHAKRDRIATPLGHFKTTYYSHGIYRDPKEHEYSGPNYEKVSDYGWTKPVPLEISA